jgi:tetratricopeptide (TPR) repeat protein
MIRISTKTFYIAVLWLLILAPLCVGAKVPENVLKQKDTVVVVYINDRTGRHIASGAGFVVDQSGIIATNCRIIAKWFEKTENMLVVETRGGVIYPIGDLISSKCENNLALLKIEAEGLSAVKIAADFKPRHGTHIAAIGKSSESDFAVVEGIIKDILKKDNLFEISIPVSPDKSGSPIFNLEGKAIGAAVYLPKKGKNINYAVPLKVLKQIERYRKLKASDKNLPIPKRAVIEPEKKTYDPDEYFLLATQYEKSNKYKEAIDAYKQSLRVKPDYLEAYLNLGVVYYKLGQYTEATETFKHAARIAPFSLTVYNKLGTTYILRRAYSMAVDTFKKAIKIDPYDAAAHFNLGVAYFLAGNKTEAFGEYITLKDIDKERADRLRDIIN